MRITFLSPSAPHPVGGVTALYGFANALARRGHHVNLLHCPFFGNRIESLDDLSWYRFEPGVEHRMVEPGEPDLPEADVFFGTTPRDDVGLPVLLLQGFEMLHTFYERQGFGTPCLKICVASWLVDVGRALGVPDDQLCVVPMGLDHDQFRVTTSPADRPPRVAILHSSHKAKGWAIGRRALELVREEVPELTATSFGTAAPPGPLPPWMEFTLDPSQDALVRDIYNGSQVFVQASDHEGFGFTAIEAMASGCALVTTDNGGSRDYADHGRTALVVPPRDPEALAEAMLRILRDDRLRLDLAEAGRRHVLRFDWDRGAELMEGHLERYVAEPARYRAPYELIEPPGDWTVESVLRSSAPG